MLLPSIFNSSTFNSSTFNGLRSHLARLFLAALAGPLVALAFGSAPAQSQDQSPNLFGEVIDVRVVNLEVVVSARGELVGGLRLEDFSLEVDGKDVPIEYFTEVSAGVASGASAGQSMVPALASGEPVGTSYLLFIDNMFSIQPRRNLVLRRVIDQLSHLQPVDRMAVVAYNGERLEVLSPWSQSLETLRRVLEDFLARPGYGMRSRAEEVSFLSPAGSSSDPVPMGSSSASSGGSSGGRQNDGGGGEFEGFSQSREVETATTFLAPKQEQAVAWIAERTTRVATAATASLRSFAKAPGRKVMLLMSGGWPDDPTDWVLRGSERTVTSGSDDRIKIYGPLINTANRLGYTLYPIDVRGISDPDSVYLRATLRRLAHQTGGKPMLAGDGLLALEKTAEDTRSYYWLGFVPQWKGNGNDHRIHVAVRRKGHRVRSRRNFSDLSRGREVSMMVESTLRVGETPESMSFPVQVGEIRRGGRGKVDVQLQMLVPVSELTFLPHRGEYVADVEMRVAILDDQGTSTDIPVVPVRISLEQPPKPGEMKKWQTKIKIHKQKHDVVVSFFDGASGKLLASRLRVDPNSL